MATTRYAEPADLTRLSLPASALTGIATADQEAALNAASDVADSYLGQRFELPLTAWEDDLKRAVCNIAAYDLMSRRGYAPRGADTAAEDNIRLRYKDAIAWLERVAAGKVNPVGVVDAKPETSPGGVVRYTAQPMASTTNEGAFITGTPRGRGW